jgi:cytoskeletal protein RodZ
MTTSIGQQLRLAREERGVALREISDQTRISMRYLEAIETNDYKRLPGGIFNRSFIKAYARCIGFDEKEAVEAYVQMMRAQGKENDDPILNASHDKIYTDTPATRSPWLTVLLAILILAILTLGVLGGLHWYKKHSATGNESPLTTGLLLNNAQPATTVGLLSARKVRDGLLA